MTTTRAWGLMVLVAAIAMAAPQAAWAHTAGGLAGGFVSGFLHPIKGPDHLVAMIAVGLWGAQLGRPLLFALPIAFPLVMALGGLLGVLGVPLPAVELGIALSALLLGLVVAMAFRAPTWLAVLLVSVFAIFHGHAHGTELPHAADAAAYGLGFVTATGLLHAVGIAIGLLNDVRSVGPAIVRASGVVIALAGVYFTAGVLGWV